jgi:integrase/recombinase XerD
MLACYAEAAGIAHSISPQRLRHFLFTWLKTQGIDVASHHHGTPATLI